jgi:hypothetical protein
MIDLNDWRPEYDEALEAAREFARRKNKNIPPDRWADGTIGQRKVALGIELLDALHKAQFAALREVYATLQEVQAAQLETSMQAMGVYDRHGRETS